MKRAGIGLTLLQASYTVVGMTTRIVGFGMGLPAQNVCLAPFVIRLAHVDPLTRRSLNFVQLPFRRAAMGSGSHPS